MDALRWKPLRTILAFKMFTPRCATIICENFLRHRLQEPSLMAPASNIHEIFTHGRPNLRVAPLRNFCVRCWHFYNYSDVLYKGLLRGAPQLHVQIFSAASLLKPPKIHNLDTPKTKLSHWAHCGRNLRVQSWHFYNVGNVRRRGFLLSVSQSHAEISSVTAFRSYHLSLQHLKSVSSKIGLTAEKTSTYILGIFITS